MRSDLTSNNSDLSIVAVFRELEAGAVGWKRGVHDLINGNDESIGGFRHANVVTHRPKNRTR
jgi:hypothetical protein